MIWKIVRLFVNTLTSNDKYSLYNRDHLTEPNQMLLPQKQRTFSEIFATFLKYRLNFEHFQTKDDPHSCCLSEILVSEKHG